MMDNSNTSEEPDATNEPALKKQKISQHETKMPAEQERLIVDPEQEHLAKVLTNDINRTIIKAPSLTQGSKSASIINLANSNLFPDLPNDMFVLKAPSLVVPYIYVKPASSKLKEIIEKIGTEFKCNQHYNENLDDLLKNVNEKMKNIDKENKSEGGHLTDIMEFENYLSDNYLLTDKKTKSYFKPSFGKFFIDIGTNLVVREYAKDDLIKLEKGKLQKFKENRLCDVTFLEMAINQLQNTLNSNNKHNESFKFLLKQCEFCNFKTESSLIMGNHHETPHYKNKSYKCSFCAFEVRNSDKILYHMKAVHNLRGQIEKNMLKYQCSYCPFENSYKSIYNKHETVCGEIFQPKSNLCPSNWESRSIKKNVNPYETLASLSGSIIPHQESKHSYVVTPTQLQATPNQKKIQDTNFSQNYTSNSKADYHMKINLKENNPCYTASESMIKSNKRIQKTIKDFFKKEM